MTAEEKMKLAVFFDTAGDFLRDGHWRTRSAPFFEDDAVFEEKEGEQKKKMEATGDSLEQIAKEIRACQACDLCSVRILAVPGEGSSRPLVLTVGEAPGADEDASGRPFVGRAGQLLDKMLAAIGLSRETNCFIANTVKCRPPGNRDPLPHETAQCAHFFERQTAILCPQFILCVGRIAAQTLLNTEKGIGELRGRFFEYKGIPLIPTYHPSALLRNEALKRPAWEDLKILKKEIDELTAPDPVK
jgi:DNA polymerase